MSNSAISTAGSHQGDTRRRLLEAAAARVHEKGFARTTLDEIAADVNIAKATFYHHFKSKAELGGALIDYNVGKFFEFLKASIFKQEFSGLTQLTELKNFIVREFAEGDLDKGCPICNLIQDMAGDSADHRKRLNNFFSAYIGLIEGAMQRAVTDGEVTLVCTVPSAAKLYLSQLHGALLIAKTKIDASGDRTEGAAFIANACDALFEWFTPSTH